MTSDRKPRKWRAKIYLLVILSLGGPALAIGVSLYAYLSNEIETRRTLSFMNYEQQAYRIKDTLRQDADWALDNNQGKSYLKFIKEPRALFDHSSQVPTKVFGGITADELKELKKVQLVSGEILLLKVSGQAMILRRIFLAQSAIFGVTELPAGRYTAIWNANLDFLKETYTANTQFLYLLNREASLIFSSRRKVAEQDILKRPLVQDFIKSPLSRAVSGIKNTKDGPQYHFFMAIPDTNLILFVENAASQLFAPLLKTAAIALGSLGFLLGVILLVWRDIASSLKNQALALSQALDDFSRGFLIPTQLEEQDFSQELHPLAMSINQSTRGIRERIDLIEKKNS